MKSLPPPHSQIINGFKPPQFDAEKSRAESLEDELELEAITGNKLNDTLKKLEITAKIKKACGERMVRAGSGDLGYLLSYNAVAGLEQVTEMCNLYAKKGDKLMEEGKLKEANIVTTLYNQLIHRRTELIKESCTLFTQMKTLSQENTVEQNKPKSSPPQIGMMLHTSGDIHVSDPNKPTVKPESVRVGE